VHVIEGEGAALLTRVHHTVGDGIALARVLLSGTDQGAGTGCWRSSMI
jgi:hypothetical protein